MPTLIIDPPLLNSANPWATTFDDLSRLYDCPFTGAVTTRTCLLDGFLHNPKVHQYTFFDVQEHVVSKEPNTSENRHSASLNTLGYSPITLEQYLQYIRKISDAIESKSQESNTEIGHLKSRKTFIVSVTGTAEEISTCWTKISTTQQAVCMPLAMEINLSCPNIPNKPPPAYSGEQLAEYLSRLDITITQQNATSKTQSHANGTSPIAVGIKTPPYTHAGQFDTLISTLLAQGKASEGGKTVIDFITATNTLGSCLVLAPYADADEGPSYVPVLHSSNGTGIGGLAGAPLHPLALGNVLTLRQKLDEHKELKDIQIIGVGGVSDNDAFWRMRDVGAAAVGIGTALGKRGIQVFEEITKGAVGRNKPAV